MRKLVTAVVGVAALCGMTAFAETPSKPPVTASEHIMSAHAEAEVLHAALMESRHDTVTLGLLEQAFKDRTTLLQSELDRVEKAQATLAAMKSGDKASIEQAREAMKAVRETVVANAKTFSADCMAIRKHLQSVQHEGKGHQAPSPSGTADTTP